MRIYYRYPYYGPIITEEEFKKQIKMKKRKVFYLNIFLLLVWAFVLSALWFWIYTNILPLQIKNSATIMAILMIVLIYTYSILNLINENKKEVIEK